MMNFTFDELGFKKDGKDVFMISGEFHYFRVPKSDWRRRMELYKAAGGNCIATYVPWLIHEPTEGNILFDDIPQRSLTEFLQTAKEVGLMVTLRPGPYQYSELAGCGLPDWLLDNYPQVKALDIDGNEIMDASVSYLHSTFLEKARKYYKAFTEVVKPFIGDPVVMLQTDNEATGIHVWFGSIDYHPAVYGFGKEDGRYLVFLKNKYGCIEKLNAAYGTDFADFASVKPAHPGKGKEITLRRKDYYDCYYASIGEYLCLLRDWLIEDGIDLPICHNSANPSMNSCFVETVEKMKKPFLLGSDHYYTLHQEWRQNNPTPQYAIKSYYSMEMMRLFGNPPSVLELPGGSPSDTPPILPNDLLACYFANLAMGMKGCNYYIYTGGPNFENTGDTADIYDYNAFVRADGSINDTYYSLKTFNEFCNAHAWMQRANRRGSAVVGFEWMATREESDDFGGDTVNGFKFVTTGALYTMMCGKYAPEMITMEKPLDLSRPLILPCKGMMSKKAQQKTVEFIKAGGKVLLLGKLPETDLDFAPCTVLADAIGGKVIEPKRARTTRFEEIGNVFGLSVNGLYEELPQNAAVLAKESLSGKPNCIELAMGEGKLIYLACSWKMTTFDQARMMEYLLDRLGATPAVSSSNRSIFTSLIEDHEGHAVLFVLNLYSSPQKTDVTVYNKDGSVKFEGHFDLAAMEVANVDL